MRKFARARFLAAILLAGQTVSLWGITVTELQEKMLAGESSISTIQFDYIQVMRSTLVQEVRESSGTVYIKKPRQLRVEQTGPEKQLVVSSGKQVYIYTPRFNQAVRDSWDHWFSKNAFFPGLSGFSGTMQKLKVEYEWEIGGSADLNGEKTMTVRLKKGRQESGQEILNLWVGESDFIPRKTEWVLGTLRLTTTLVSMKQNPELNPDLFKFELPAGTKMIRMPN